MAATEQTQKPRLLTGDELAVLVKLYREFRQWSQEQLADLSGLSVRTIQRVERGEPSGLDTRRAIARAFEFEDIDALNKPFLIPTDEELKAEKEKFEREHITLKASPLATGKQLAQLAETNSMDLSSPAFEMSREADEEFAALVDCMREYRDCSDLYSEVQKFDVYDEMQQHIDALKALGVSLRYAVRKLKMKFTGDPESRPVETSAVYVVAFPIGKEPDEFATPRAVGVKA
ncbi:MAG: helix-turn-helix domain-containing protein [Paraburkholderia sp.]|uniref:helix-turn-helix transcriptional regulator n=1 Tax=Paraburkholderia sp. TaxID=1926495 RepID=UPI001207EB5C|nr:helix-turn-helix domain-containing protein [Paraburkholderia sp.]TAM06370.1 MAG: helix-turn-helix domain-containing protein [Paraburkholderia sp.]